MLAVSFFIILFVNLFIDWVISQLKKGKMLDLYNKCYPIDTLKENIYALSVTDILKTQRLTVDFIVNYVLNPKYHLSRRDKKIQIVDVLRYQPHITRMEIVLAICLNGERENENEKDLDFEAVASEKND